MCLSEQSGPIPAAVQCGCVFVYAFSSRKWTSVQDCLVSVCHWEARWISVARGAGRVSAAPGACPGSAGFNQQHHLPLLRVIGAQWAPSATLPSTSAPQHPSAQHGALCIYIGSIAHAAVRRYICSPTPGHSLVLLHIQTHTSQRVEMSAHIRFIFIV